MSISRLTYSIVLLLVMYHNTAYSADSSMLRAVLPKVIFYEVKKCSLASMMVYTTNLSKRIYNWCYQNNDSHNLVEDYKKRLETVQVLTDFLFNVIEQAVTSRQEKIELNSIKEPVWNQEYDQIINYPENFGARTKSQKDSLSSLARHIKQTYLNIYHDARKDCTTESRRYISIKFLAAIFQGYIKMCILDKDILSLNISEKMKKELLYYAHVNHPIIMGDYAQALIDKAFPGALPYL